MVIYFEELESLIDYAKNSYLWNLIFFFDHPPPPTYPKMNFYHVHLIIWKVHTKMCSVRSDIIIAQWHSRENWIKSWFVSFLCEFMSPKWAWGGHFKVHFAWSKKGKQWKTPSWLHYVPPLFTHSLNYFWCLLNIQWNFVFDILPRIVFKDQVNRKKRNLDST